MHEESTNTRILLGFLRIATLQLLTAFGIVAIVELLELVLVPSIARSWPIPELTTYTSWLGTIAQIGGVFIALYFTAVTAAAGAIYSQVPNNVRHLLARDRVGNIYIRYLIFATFVPLSFIALTLLGFRPLRFAIPTIALAAGIGIIAFAKLGQRAFDLFDPTNFSNPLLEDLDRWVLQVSAGGFKWLDPAFQKHAHRQAALILDTTDTLADISTKNSNLDSGPLLDLTRKILEFLARYQKQKLAIPTSSLWFEQKYQQKDWYLTEDSSVEFAYRAGITLSPTVVTEHDWLEKRLEPILLKCFELNIRRKRSSNLFELLEIFSLYARSLAAIGEVQRAISLSESLVDSYETVGVTAQTESQGEIETIAVADRLSVIQIQIMLAYYSSHEARTPEATKTRLKKIRWNNLKSIYKSDWLVGELRQLEWLHPRLQLEEKVEGRVVTPIWYLQALISKAQAEAFAVNSEVVLTIGENVFQPWINRFSRAGNLWASASVLSRYIEYQSKFESRQLQWLQDYFKSLQTARYLKDLAWPEVTPQTWPERVARSRSGLNKSLGSQIASLLDSKRPQGTFDYLGQFVHSLGEEVFNSLLNNRSVEIAYLIGPYFVGSLGLFEKLKPVEIRPDIWTEQQLQVAAAPILDLMELSGYAKLMAEFYKQEQLWKMIQDKWDVFLNAQTAGLAWTFAIVTAGLPAFQLPHRGLIRTNWEIRITQQLGKLPRKSIARGRSRIRGTIFDEAADHESALVRYCARYEFKKGVDIFVGLYLSKRPGAETFQWQPEQKDLDKSLQREEELYRENDETA